MWLALFLGCYSYKDTTLFFAILFFIIKCALISVKIFDKFWHQTCLNLHLFQLVMWLLTSH